MWQKSQSLQNRIVSGLGINAPQSLTWCSQPDPLLSVLRVSTLGRSTSGPRPRSSPCCLTLAPPTSGYPLSTARAMPAVSDTPGPAHPSALPVVVRVARLRVGCVCVLWGELAGTFRDSWLCPTFLLSPPTGRRLGRCANHRSDV